MAPVGFAASTQPAESRERVPGLSRWFQEEILVHEAELRAYLRSRFSSLTDHEDLIQDCYARLLRLRETGPLPITRAYLFVTARNAALDQIRRRKIIPFDPLDYSDASPVVEEGRDAADQLCHDEELQLLHHAIGELPPRCREIVVLARLHRVPHREIARRLTIAESTVHAQLSLALKKCRQFFADHGVTQARLDAQDPD